MDAISAVRQAAARHGMALTDEAVRDIADAALGAYDKRVTVRHRFNPMQWDSSDRKRLEQGLRRELLYAVADAGMVPADRPIEVRTRADDGPLFAADDMEVSMTMHVRKPRAVPAPT